MTNKPFVLADIKDLINQLDLEEISMSRLVEILNEKADAASEDKSVGFAEWVDEHFTNFKQHVYISNFHDGSYGKSHISPKYFTLKEIYQLYLKSKQKQHIVDIMNDDAKDGI